MLQSLQIYRMLIFGIALVVIMVVRPRGFISTRTPPSRSARQRLSGRI
jgi:branched-chain amino acid transport system permease protein